MPKKPARSSKPAKKVVAKKSAPKKKVAPMKMAASRSVAASSSQKTFRGQQDDFHKDHPNAQALLLTFLVSFGLLVFLYMKLGW